MAKATQTETTAPAARTTTTAPTNGAQTAQGEGADQEGQKRSRGALPTMPICALYKRADGKVVAEIISPLGEGPRFRYSAVGKGQGSAKGNLEDTGFVLSGVHNNPPQWVADRKVIPEGVEIIGFCNVSGFPLPPQD